MTSADYVQRSPRGSGGIVQRDGNGRRGHGMGHGMGHRCDGPVGRRTQNDRGISDGILLNGYNVMLGGGGMELFADESGSEGKRGLCQGFDDRSAGGE